jgi:hypothetical protein
VPFEKKRVLERTPAIRNSGKETPHIKNDGRKVKTTPIDLIYNLASNPKMKSNSVGFI